MTDARRVRDHLYQAFDQLVAALALSGGIPEEIPDDALDAALGNDFAVQEARLGLISNLNRVIEMNTSDGRQAYIAIEAAANAYAARCAEAGYRLGLRVCRGRQ
jgi:hypothetical protein